ncbi:MAG: LLM class flavin-dependent oxidoreductase [Chloroflexi bacterium]|nr:LLM class flavin-dependent oxidoreductase [Chloroflexota bacterium]
MATLEFGIWDHFEQQDPERVPLTQQYAERLELIVQAERLGFSRYHIAEHHLTPLDMAPSPNVFLAAVARETTRIRLGSMVMCLPLYHPVRLLQEICMLDHLSEGRLEPGVGRGVRDIEHEWFGLDASQSRERYKETFDLVIQGLLTGKLNYQGQYYAYHDVPVHFAPAQRPLPPMWYAGNIQSAARQGLNGLGRSEGRDAYAAYWRTFDAGRASGNALFQRAPRVGSTRHLLIADTDADARAIARRAWRAYGEHFFATDLRNLGQTREPQAYSAGADPDTQIASGALLVGSPTTVRDKLDAYVKEVYPLHNYLVAAFQWGDLTHAEAMHSLQLYATQVMPALAERRVAAAA